MTDYNGGAGLRTLKQVGATLLGSATALLVLGLLLFVWIVGMPGLSILVKSGLGG